MLSVRRELSGALGCVPAQLNIPFEWLPSRTRRSFHLHPLIVVGQIHATKCRVLPSGKVSFDAERNARCHADKFWVVALACQKERQEGRPRGGEIGVRVLG